MSKKSEIRSNEEFFDAIRDLIVTARSVVARNINTVQVFTSFEIGRRIVEEEQKGETRAKYGKKILSDLAARLTREFGKGFSERNLRNMRTFFLTYQDRALPIWQKPSAKSISDKKEDLSAFFLKWQKSSATLEIPFKLSWSHYVFLCTIEEEEERNFYEIEALSGNWTLSELKRQYNSGLHKRLDFGRKLLRSLVIITGLIKCKNLFFYSFSWRLL